MNLHGHTKIILKGPDGERVYEHDNALTLALEEIFTPFGMYHNGECFCENRLDMTRLFGGLLCFDKALDSGVTTFPGDATIIASGVYKAANNGANEIRGTYNSVESNIDWANKSLRFVYDFATNQGNGKLAAICLTPLYGGYMNEGKARTVVNYSTRFPLDDLDYYWKMNNYEPNYGNRFDQYSGFHVVRRDCSGYGASGGNSTTQEGYYFRCIEIDEEKDTRTEAYLKSTSPGKQLTLVLRTMPAFIHGGSLYEMQGITPAYTEVTIPLGDSLNTYRNNYMVRLENMNYDWERRKLYVCTFPYHYWYNQGYRNYIEPDEPIRVFEVDVDTNEVKTYDITNQTGVRLAKTYQDSFNYPGISGYCYNGYLYFVSRDDERSDTTPHTLYKIKLTDPGKVTTFPTKWTGTEPFIEYAQNGRLYTRDRYVINTDLMINNGYTELSMDDRVAVPIKGRSVLMSEDGRLLGIKPQTLMTVNNIEPITKTPAQTMKIVYTLSGS